ncbi:hypothetical protein INT48_009764 [Thamnidium elegans]|uniref:HPt domain-containing protein n=1 Tax=Thamnidium elegans TaxID=101142 RepID=A0A8H7SRU7_9FUNG|nr:hypothetical protein INT48_009764 [Thamnidium elegans]
MTSREGTPDPTFLKSENKMKKNDTSADLAKEEELKEIEDNEKILNPEDLIDMNTFEQLLDMDDEDDHEFSYSIVLNYFEQADTTFKDMDNALLGHFLKGSSAAIGLKRVKATCEKIQNVGNRQDEEGTAEIDEEEALKRITPLLPQVKTEYSEAEEYLKNFYEVQDAR